MTRGRRRGLKLAAALAAAVIVLALVLGQVFPGPSGPTGSSYATAPTGLGAYATLLARSGHPVTRLREVPSRARLSTASTLVVLDPTQILAPDVAALRRFVAAGGTLVAGGQDPEAWLSELVPDPPAWSSTGPTAAVPLLPAPQTVGVGEVVSAGEGSWSDPRGTLPILGAPGAPVVTTATLGAGEIVLLADSSPLQNRLLDQAGNAAFGLALAGAPGRPVAFEEALHGYGATNGLAALPQRWKWALVGAVLTALVAVAARFRRLAAPDPAPPPALPPRREHVEALARALAHTGDPGGAAGPVRDHARAQLLERARLPAEAGADEVARAAARLGLDSAQVRALTEPESSMSDDDVLAAGRALVELSGGRG